MTKIAEQKLAQFSSDLASSSPSPGGGSAAAVAGMLGASLVHMVATLTVGRKKYAAVQDEMQDIARESAELMQLFGELADRDALAYDGVMEAYKLPKDDDADVSSRNAAIDAALHHAASVPLETLRAALRTHELALAAALSGNPNAVSDAGAGALLAGAAFEAARYNVLINIGTTKTSPEWARAMEAEISELGTRNMVLASQVREKVLSVI